MGARRLMIVLYVLEWGLPSSENTKHRTCERDPQLRSWTGSCSVGDEPSRGQLLIEDEPLEPRDGCLYYDSRVGVSLGTQTNW